MRTIVESALDKARDVLNRERSELDRSAQLLLEKETLGEEDLKAFRGGAPSVTG